MSGSAWLTAEMMSRCMNGPMMGRVHSVFEHVANVAFFIEGTETQSGYERLLTLTVPNMPRLPDSARISMETLKKLSCGMRVEMEVEALACRMKIADQTVEFQLSTDWSGRVDQPPGIVPEPGNVEIARQALEAADNGFRHMPGQMRISAQKALLSGEAQRYLGLGAGLTPSFDDACVGAMALCRAFDYPSPFNLENLTVTTDVSARYLRLALKGYFGEPLCQLMSAFKGQGDIRTALKNLLSVGATSGADMLFGAMYILENLNF